MEHQHKTSTADGKLRERTYLDNAATSWPKPEPVYLAVDHYQRKVGAPNGRSGYQQALESNRIVERARAGVAQLIGVDDPRQVIFTASGTDSLNMAIGGILSPGDHVVTTVCDHNSVLRPLRHLQETAGISVSYLPCNGQGIISPDDLRQALRAETRLVAIVHGSNVTGAIQPVEDMGKIVRQHGALLLVDAAQTVGHQPIDVGRMKIDLLAAPGHKGLLGPLGTGILAIRPGVEKQMRPFRMGGTGSQSEQDRQPDELPDKYEPGNHNLPGLAGLAAATKFLDSRSVDTIHRHHTALTTRLVDGLSEIPELTIHGPDMAQERTSVVSISIAECHPQDLAAILEASYGIQTRAGLHCAPKMHEALGTTSRGGTLRLSPGWATTHGEIDRTIEAVAKIAAAKLAES